MANSTTPTALPVKTNLRSMTDDCLVTKILTKLSTDNQLQLQILPKTRTDKCLETNFKIKTDICPAAGDNQAATRARQTTFRQLSTRTNEANIQVEIQTGTQAGIQIGTQVVSQTTTSMQTVANKTMEMETETVDDPTQATTQIQAALTGTTMTFYAKHFDEPEA